MEEFNSIGEILDYAINEEQKASELYADLAKRSINKEMSEVFTQFSLEELGHKKKLKGIKSNQKIVFSEEMVPDLKIGDYIVEVDSSRDDLKYQDALIIAMKAEKAAFRMYMDLSTKTENPEAKQIFTLLAQEEAKHKLRFEIEYDEYILREN